MKWQISRQFHLLHSTQPAELSAIPSRPAANGIEEILSPPSRRGWLFCVFLLAATFIAYQPVWHAGFVWDDNQYVTGNVTLHSLDGLRRIWFELGATVQYYPLTFTSFWVEHHLWGLHPLGYHLVNIMLHALNAMLLWLVLHRLGVRGAWLAAGIFALHPVCVESVAWVTERKNTLSGLFYLGSLLAALSFWLPRKALTGSCMEGRAGDSTGGPGGWKFCWLALGLYLCALWSKTATVPLPAVILLLVWWKRGRLTWRDIHPLLPFLTVGIAMGLITMRVEKGLGAGAGGAMLSFLERCLLAGRVFWFSLGKLFWPHPLIFIYPRWQINASQVVAYLPALAAAAGLLALWQMRGAWARATLFAFGYFLLLLFPVLGLFDVFFFHYSYVADHFQYFACIGPLALAAAAIITMLRPFKTRRLFLESVLGGTLLLALGILTWRQNTTYTDAKTLWGHTLAKNPDAWMAYNNLGAALADQGRFSEAIVEYQGSLRINPDNVEADNNLGTALVRLGRVPEAIGYWEQALQIKPDYAEAHNNLGIALAQVGRVKEAIGHWERALQIKPDLVEAHNDLGAALMQAGKLEDAIGHYEQALRIKPDFAEAHYDWGIALVRLGRVPEAIRHWEQALRLKPDYAEAHYNLGIALGQAGRPDEAIGHYEQALKIKPDYADAHYRLALTLKDQGRFQEAIAHYRNALELKPRPMLAQNALAWLLATCPEATWRNGSQAVELAQQAEQLSGGKHPEILDTLAAAYAEAGRFPDAVETAERALHLASNQSNTVLADDIRTRLKLYETNSPYREKP
jgi:tetratricopeptide (TPR) repeat protein